MFLQRQGWSFMVRISIVDSMDHELRNKFLTRHVFQSSPFTRIVAKQIKTLSQTSGGPKEKETSLNVPRNTIHVNRVKASQL